MSAFKRAYKLAMSQEYFAFAGSVDSVSEGLRNFCDEAKIKRKEEFVNEFKKTNILDIDAKTKNECAFARSGMLGIMSEKTWVGKGQNHIVARSLDSFSPYFGYKFCLSRIQVS